MRFQVLMPDVLHWLGVKHIHRLVSMSNLKYNAITGSGITVGLRYEIPEDLVRPASPPSSSSSSFSALSPRASLGTVS